MLDTTEEQLFAEAFQLQQQAQLPEAITLYEQLLSHNPAHELALHYLALAHAQQGDMPTAIRFFLQALQFSPADAVLHNNLGNAYKNNQQQDFALVHYQKAIELQPHYAQAQNNLAGIYALQGLYPQALQHYRLAVHAEPDFAAAHFNLGLLLMSHRKLNAAYTQFKNVLILNPDHMEAQFYIGVLDLEANRLPAAEQAFQAVLLRDGHHLQALTNLGVIALKNQQKQQAIDYFSKVIALDNDHHEARHNLAATFIHHDRFENALMHYDILLKKEPNNSEYLYNSGVAQMALGHLNEAINHFEQLIHLDEHHFSALNNLAAIYIRLEDRVKARELLKRAIAANPDDKSSQHMLHALSGSHLQAETCPDYAANLFNNYALYYDQHLQKHLHYTLPNHIVRLIDELAIPTVNDALDLGCGTGLTGQVLRDHVVKLHGVDIANKMLQLAEEKGIYDQLIEKEALTFLQQTSHSYGFIVAADVLPYFGELSALFHAVAKRLNPKGYFIFTTEISANHPWQLNPSGRFCHHIDYLRQLATQHGLQLCHEEQIIARQQDGKALPVWFIALQKTL